MARKRYCPDARAATVKARRTRSSTRDLAFVVRSLRNAAHRRVFAMTPEAARAGWLLTIWCGDATVAAVERSRHVGHTERSELIDA
jgi:hypothetical protein